MPIMFLVGVNDAIWKILGKCFMLCEIGHRLKTFLEGLALRKNNISGRKVGMTTIQHMHGCRINIPQLRKFIVYT